MLRITLHDDAASTTLKLVGRLTGPWVMELERCWRATRAAQPERPLRVDLTEVSFVDAAGKQLLDVMVRRRTQLLGAGLMVQAIIEEIVRQQDEAT